MKNLKLICLTVLLFAIVLIGSSFTKSNKTLLCDNNVTKSITNIHSNYNTIDGDCWRCSGSGRCQNCGGRGMVKCNYCNGRGQTESMYQNPDGSRIYNRCDYCNGTGKLDCGGCSGSGNCGECKGSGKSPY